MSLSIAEQARIRQAVAAVDDDEAAGLQRSNVVALHRLWSEDLIVNEPTNQVAQSAEVLNRLRNQSGLQYSTFERHREATVVRENCAVTMGYEVVVPNGNGPDAGRKIRRRYTNVYTFAHGEWRLTARQATNISGE
jgi:hypothetical protein